MLKPVEKPYYPNDIVLKLTDSLNFINKEKNKIIRQTFNPYIDESTKIWLPTSKEDSGIYLSYQNIIYVTKVGDYTFTVCEYPPSFINNCPIRKGVSSIGANLGIGKSLEAISTILNKQCPDKFLHITRSYVINKEQVIHKDGNNLIMKNGNSISIGNNPENEPYIDNINQILRELSNILKNHKK